MTGDRLLAWYDLSKRDLPWRRTRDPYAVWVSEVMLQQTQVATVAAYFERWMARFPTVGDLAAEDEETALSLWQGLGYYRRCRLLLKGARWVSQNGMPNDAEGWRRVPGVGPYTAGAISSIAFGEAVPAVDGNVERVFARLAGCRESGPKLKSSAWKWACRNLHRDRPGDWNQALMELGAVVCTPRGPSCSVCPLADRCEALQTRQVEELPVRRPRDPVVHLRHVVWVPVHQRLFGVRQVAAGSWWQGMWEFPRVTEAEGVESLEELLGLANLEVLGVVQHSVTHHRIVIATSLAHCEEATANLRWLSPAELESLPMPAPQRKILRMALESCRGV